MPSLFAFCVQPFFISDIIHLHYFDNGFLICYDDWGVFMLVTVMLEEAKLFFSVILGSLQVSVKWKTWKCLSEHEIVLIK